MTGVPVWFSPTCYRLYPRRVALLLSVVQNFRCAALMCKTLPHIGSCLHVQAPQQPFGGPGQQQAQQMQWQAPGQVINGSKRICGCMNSLR